MTYEMSNGLTGIIKAIQISKSLQMVHVRFELLLICGSFFLPLWVYPCSHLIAPCGYFCFFEDVLCPLVAILDLFVIIKSLCNVLSHFVVILRLWVAVPRLFVAVLFQFGNSISLYCHFMSLWSFLPLFCYHLTSLGPYFVTPRGNFCSSFVFYCGHYVTKIW